MEGTKLSFTMRNCGRIFTFCLEWKIGSCLRRKRTNTSGISSANFEAMFWKEIKARPKSSIPISPKGTAMISKRILTFSLVTFISKLSFNPSKEKLTIIPKDLIQSTPSITIKYGTSKEKRQCSRISN